jgi:recombination associated protein RdgC
MWFKNLAIYRFTETFKHDPAELEQQLEQYAFKPCGSMDMSKSGWTPPLGDNGQQLVHTGNGFMMLCIKKQEKVIPTPVINEQTSEQVQLIEEQQARKLRKKERDDIRDEVIHSLLPKAFTISRRTYAIIDPKGGWIMVDAASSNKAEELLSYLRETLDGLPVVPLTTASNPSSIMTQWLSAQTPGDITIENECELTNLEQEGSLIRCKRQDLSLPEIMNHLENGKKVTKLAVIWAERMSFVIEENLAIKRLKFLDLIQDQAAEVNTSDQADQFDVDFSIMSLELAAFLPRLIELFGGEQQST